MSNDLMSKTDNFFLNKEKAEQAFNMCKYYAQSSLVPQAVKGKPHDLFVILSLAFELDVPPTQAINSFTVIHGKPCIPPQMMIALVRRRLPGAVINFDIDYQKNIAACTTARSKEDFKDGLVYKSVWDIERAKQMGLMGKDNYRKQLITMLKWRSCSESCRVTFADIILGLYTPEEFDDSPTSTVYNEPVSKPVLTDLISTKEELEQDFPIPEEERVVGDLYRIQNGKFRGKQLKDLTNEDIESYTEYLESQLEKDNKDWVIKLHAVLSEYAEKIGL